MKRRQFVAWMATLNVIRSHLLAANATMHPLGICAFSCHLHWQAVRGNQPGTSFSNTSSFYDYARTLGADGVQTSFRELDAIALKSLRAKCDEDGSYLEGDIRIPKSSSDLEDFEREVRLTRETGARVARAVLMGGRRYETFQSLSEFQDFHRQTRTRLELAEPILRKHGLKLAVENHKDLTVDEQVELLKQISSEWVGALVDTGNNLALLDDPYRSVELLAPFALSVHLKDMAVQPSSNGFLLSEVRCGVGFLDLRRMIATLRAANPQIVFNLEMATREPLSIPCLSDRYWNTFPDRKSTHLDAAMELVKRHPIHEPPPSILDKTMDRLLADEEGNNRVSLSWMHEHIL